MAGSAATFHVSGRLVDQFSAAAPHRVKNLGHEINRERGRTSEAPGVAVKLAICERCTPVALYMIPTRLNTPRS